MILVSFGIKVGLFPWVGWISRVYSGVSWCLLYFLAVVSKVPLLCIPVFGITLKLSLLVGVTLLVCFFAIWRETSCLKEFIAFSSIASSRILFYFCRGGFVWESAALLLIYCISQFFLFFSFSFMAGDTISGGVGVYSLFVVLALPFSLMVVYKVWVSFSLCVIGSPLLVV